MIKNRKGDKAVRVCDVCGDEKEVSYWNLVKKKVHRCYSCSNKETNLGKPSPFKGTRREPKNVGNIYTHSDGYPMVWVGKTNVSSGYMPVHRLVASDKIGRLVTNKEKVHHVNGIKHDYSEDNLFLCRDMSHHRQVHSQLEEVSMFLVSLGLIGFNHNTGEYCLSRPIKKLIEEKQGELLGTPNANGEGNQQLSSAELAEKVQRLFREEVPSSEGKRPAPEKDDDIVCSSGKPLAGFSSGESSSDGS